MADWPAAVVLAGITKSFDGFSVLRGLDLSIAPGSVTALLGPSGCGKTTALRIVAGLEDADAGTVEIGGVVASGQGVNVPTEQRRVGMIFQNGALFPHLSVAHNVGYGLARADRKDGPRIWEMLELVGLAGFGDRRPDSLSGGQAQRVALARALAPAPAVVLMDEPFSNLDAVLRARLRREVGDVVRAARVTVLLVTHDRDEAFAVADRVAVMRDGVIVQEGPPRELYLRPADRWVAGFVGDVNFVAATVADGVATTALGRLQVEETARGVGDVVVRPEDLVVSDGAAEAAEATVAAVVVSEEYQGAATVLEVRLGDGVMLKAAVRGDARFTSGAVVGVRRRSDAGPAVFLPGP